MTRTLLLAEHPFRSLRSAAVLASVAARLGDGDPLLVAGAPSEIPPDFVPVPADPDPAALGIRRVVIAGIFHDAGELARAFATAARALGAGARLELRALTLDRAAARREPPPGHQVIERAALIELREAHTANALLVWRIAAPFRLAPYPERALAADPALAAQLPPGPVLGLSMLGGPDAERFWRPNLAPLRERLARFDGVAVLPLPAEAPGSPADDLAGSIAFARDVLPRSKLLLPGLEDAAWRQLQLTAPRLAGLAARCGTVVASQDLPALAAIAAGVPVIGLGLGQGGERRILSVFATLANELPAGSDYLMLPPGRR